MKVPMLRKHIHLSPKNFGGGITFLALLCFWPLLQSQQTERAAKFDVFAPEQTADALKVLSIKSQTIIGRLSKFNSLSLGAWRYKAGDVTGGQYATLDDSSWQQLETPYATDTTGVVWLRQWIQVPNKLSGYDLTGTRMVMQAWGKDWVTVYFNGQRVAEGDNLEPIILFGSAKPGDKVLVAIRLEVTPRVKNISAAKVTIEYTNNRPSPDDMYNQFVTAALLVPSLAKDLPTAKSSLEKAIGDVDLKALDANSPRKFDDSLRQSQKDLESLRPILQQATFHVTGDSHIDSAWLWPWTETVDIVRRTFGTALQLMNEYPNYTYTQSAMQYNEWMAEKYPQINAKIKQRIKEGRWEVVGGMWVEPDLNMPDGESQVRQLLIGQRTIKQLYGITTRVGWNPDSFGYDWQLPQIYKKSGMDYFVTSKLAANETNPLPFKIFWWESPDGSKVLTYLPHGYGSRNLDPVRLSNDLLKARSFEPGMLEMMDLYGVSDHGGGPTRNELDQGFYWMKPDKVVPKIQFGTAQGYFSGIEKKISSESPTWNYQGMANGAGTLPAAPAGQISIPTWKDELYFEHHRGTYTTQADHKRNMRESEEWTLNAEKYSSFAWLDGQRYPATELTEAWKKVLFNQFHDLAAGSGVADIYKDAQRDYDQVRWATTEASTKALNTIQAHIDTRAVGAVPILVFNPLGWERSGLVQVDVEVPNTTTNGLTVLDSDNRVLPSAILSGPDHTNTYRLLIKTKNIPSLGYEVLHVTPGAKPFASDLKSSGMTLENLMLKIVVDPHTGCITSLYDKMDSFETLAPGACGNQLQTFKDIPLKDDAWNIDPGTLDYMTPITQVDSVKMVESGPLRGVIRVTRHWQSSKFVQDIVLYTNADEVNVVNDIDWHETHTLLKAAFPLAVSSKMATYEIPYGTIERPTTRNNSWDDAKFEVPALRWADLSDEQHGLSLLNESKYGYDCKDSLLRLTLLRSPVSPDPDADREKHHFTYAIYPHSGSWKAALTVRRGYEYNYKLQAFQVQPHVGTLPPVHSFISLKNPNIVMTAVKKAEDSDGLIVRFYEWAGKNGTVKIDVPNGAQSSTLTNLMEQPEGAPLPIAGGNQVTVQVHPYEIVTVRVDYARRPEPQSTAFDVSAK